jgi:hypothetical protein
MKFGSLNLLEPSGLVQACIGITLPLHSIIPGGGEKFRTCPAQPWGPPSPLYNGYRVFPGGKEWPGRNADPSPPSSAVVMKG